MSPNRQTSFVLSGSFELYGVINSSTGRLGCLQSNRAESTWRLAVNLSEKIRKMSTVRKATVEGNPGDV